MATLGVFSRHEDMYYGCINTLMIRTRLEILPSGLEGEKSPQYRVMIGTTQVGAGWDRTSRQGEAYLCLKLDDPSFPAPIFANLVARGDEHHLVWSRDEGHRQSAD